MTAFAFPMMFSFRFRQECVSRGPNTFHHTAGIFRASARLRERSSGVPGKRTQQGPRRITHAGLMGSGMAGFAISTNLILSCALLFFSGAALLSAFAMISSLVQLITANENARDA